MTDKNRVPETVDLSKLKAVGWYVSGETKLGDDGVSLNYIGGIFEEES